MAKLIENAPKDVVVRLGKFTSAIHNKKEAKVDNLEADRVRGKSVLTTFNTKDFDFGKSEDASLVEVVIGNTALDLPLGVVAVIGQKGAGKSTLLEELANKEGTKVVYFGEALDKVEHLAQLLTDESDAMDTIALAALNEGSQSFFFDSGRFLVFGPSVGGTGRGGLDKMLFPQLSAQNNVYLACGKTMVIAINPGDVTEEDYITLVGNFEASVSTISYGYADYVRAPARSRTVDYAFRGPGFDRSSASGTITYTLADIGLGEYSDYSVGAGHSTTALNIGESENSLASGNMSQAAIIGALGEREDEE